MRGICKWTPKKGPVSNKVAKNSGILPHNKFQRNTLRLIRIWPTNRSFFGLGRHLMTQSNSASVAPACKHAVVLVDYELRLVTPRSYEVLLTKSCWCSVG